MTCLLNCMTNIAFFQNLLVATCKLVEKKLDFIVVIGKIDSNSSSYVQEIAMLNGIPCYWINDEQEIGSGNKIRYKNVSLCVESCTLIFRFELWCLLYLNYSSIEFIFHLLKKGGELVEKEKCIPAGPITVGVIPGATTAKVVLLNM